MKIEIPVCTRGTLREFKESYQPEFLSKYGYKRYTNIIPFNGYKRYTNIIPFNGVKVVCEAVNVKYSSIQGELIVYDNDILTYLGHKLWAVTKNREHEDE